MMKKKVSDDDSDSEEDDDDDNDFCRGCTVPEETTVDDAMRNQNNGEDLLLEAAKHVNGARKQRELFQKLKQ